MMGEPTADADLVESAAFELGRISRTAGAVGLPELQQAAADAAETLARGEVEGVLRGLLGTLAPKAQHVSRFPPVYVLAGGALATRLRRQAGYSTEQVQVAHSLEQLVELKAEQVPAAIAVPSRLLEEAPEQVLALEAPVFVYGAHEDWRQLLAAEDAGAAGFLPAEFEIPELVDLVRRCVQPAALEAVVLLVASEPAAIVQAFADEGIVAVAAAGPADLFGRLAEVHPDVLLLDAGLGRGVPLLVRAIRRHRRWSGIPVICLGQGADHDVLYAGGVDHVVSPTAELALLVRRSIASVRRLHAVKQDRDPVTGLLNRAGILRVLDGWLLNAQRRQRGLTVALLEIDGMKEMRETHGRAGVAAARRVVARTLLDGLRRVDLVGQVGPSTYLLALSGCGLEHAMRRVVELDRQLIRRCKADERLRGLMLRSGLADTDGSSKDLVLRAERELDRES
jgi:diguanylate cyclase (GGDEF)-like protein